MYVILDFSHFVMYRVLCRRVLVMPLYEREDGLRKVLQLEKPKGELNVLEKYII